MISPFEPGFPRGFPGSVSLGVPPGERGLSAREGARAGMIHERAGKTPALSAVHHMPRRSEAKPR